MTDTSESLAHVDEEAQHLLRDLNELREGLLHSTPLRSVATGVDDAFTPPPMVMKVAPVLSAEERELAEKVFGVRAASGLVVHGLCESDAFPSGGL